MMKRSLFAFTGIILCSGILMAGGILTNTNQSIMFTRMQARDATLGIDAVYFNPAGLGLFSDGLYISLNNQTIGQTKTIKSNYQYLNEGKYVGDVSAPLFPDIYAVYKKGNMALSFGFNPIGGGGGAKYDTGLPSFEYLVSDLVPALVSQGQDVRAYRLDAYFEGTSAFFGTQANISYKINDMISVSVGARMVNAKETYNGYLKNVQIDVGGTWTPASTFFTGLSAQASAGAISATTAATDMQPLIDGGAGGLTFAEAEAGTVIDATTRAQLEGGLTALGIDHTGMTLQQAQVAYQGAALSLTQSAIEAGAKSKLLADQEADLEKTAFGITPIFGVNISPNDKLNIALKYEHNTKLELENSTTKDIMTGFDTNGDSITMFPDGAKARLDLPTQISAGVTYKATDKLLVSGGIHYYLDKNADWNGRQDSLDGNMIELAIGLEYQLNEKLKVSGGYVYTKSGATEAYQTDLSYSLPSGTFGFGTAYALNDKMEINLGGSYTIWKEGDRNFYHDFAGSGLMVPVKETLSKNAWIVGVGLNISLGKSE